MKNNQLLIPLQIIFSLFVFSDAADAQTTITVGSSGATYSTLKAAFDAINAGAVTGVITIQVVANTAEAASAVLNASGTGSASYTSINIYPTITGLAVSGSIAVPLIDLNGADNVTIDGRVNATGSVKDLFITNTSTSNVAGTSTLRFINDATANIVKYCTIRGSEGLNSYGVIYFGISAGANGNDNNTIDNNNITNAGTRPINAVYSLGTAGKENSAVTFSNNNFYDFFSNSSTGGSAMNVLAGNTNWTITGNSFYNVSAWNPGSTGYNVIAINNTAGNDFTVSGNYIGGNAPLCAGTPFTKGGAGRDGINIIYLIVGTSAASNIQGNTIQNINYTNLNNTRNFAGIMVDAGNVNIGTTSGNTIGAATGTGSISGNNVQVFWGILTAGAGVINIENNTIGSVSMTTAANAAVAIQGISCSGSGALTIRNNTVGSLSTANSINAVSTSTAAGQQVYGIVNSTTGISTISGNTIANLSNNASGAGSFITGLYNGSSASTSVVSANFIRSLTLTNASSSANTLYGINIAGGATSYFNNIISIGGNPAASIFGIADAAGTNNIYFNTVYIQGAPTSGTNLSHAMYSNGSNTRNYRNNLLVNARSNNGATGVNYAIGITSSPAKIDYNDYYASGTNGVLGVFNAVDKITLADWKLSSVQDCNSYNVNPSFATAGGTLSADYLPGNISLMATTGTGITTDFSAASRNNSIPAMGAFEYAVTPGSNSLHISSVTPVAGVVGSSVTIDGTNFTGTTNASFNGTASSFVINSATSITATVPAGATTGPISVTLSCGTYTDISDFTIQLAVPVNWLNFDARKMQDNVLLQWSTASEQNSKDFLVQNSGDGINWLTLDKVTAAGNSNTVSLYTYMHHQPLQGNNYYRLQQRDLDHQLSYSKIVNIIFYANSVPLHIYGNPVSNGQLVIQINKAAVISIFNQNGQELFRRSFGTGLEKIQLNGYAKGMYMLKAGTHLERFIIN